MLPCSNLSEKLISADFNRRKWVCQETRVTCTSVRTYLMTELPHTRAFTSWSKAKDVCWFLEAVTVAPCGVRMKVGRRSCVWCSQWVWCARASSPCPSCSTTWCATRLTGPGTSTLLGVSFRTSAPAPCSGATPIPTSACSHRTYSFLPCCWSIVKLSVKINTLKHK